MPEGKTCFLEGVRLVRAFGESRSFVLSPSRSDLVVQSSRFDEFVENREIYNLSMVSGPGFFRNKREGLDFHTFWRWKNDKLNEIG